MLRLFGRAAGASGTMEEAGTLAFKPHGFFTSSKVTSPWQGSKHDS